MSVEIAAKIAGVTPQAIRYRVDRDIRLGSILFGRVQVDCEHFFSRETGGTGLLNLTQATLYLNYAIGANAALELGLPMDLAALVPEGANPDEPCIHWHRVEELATEWEPKAFYWSEMMRKTHGAAGGTDVVDHTKKSVISVRGGSGREPCRCHFS